MYALIVIFQLDGMSAETFETPYTDAAPIFAEMPGLLENLDLTQHGRQVESSLLIALDECLRKCCANLCIAVACFEHQPL